MPGRRPAPLSDDMFQQGQAKVIGGHLVGGEIFGVKNTFIDMPSGSTPSHFTTVTSKPMQTAPPDMTQAPGFMARAVAGGQMSATPYDRSALATPSSSNFPFSNLGNGLRQGQFFQGTPMATPSPMAQSRFPAGGYFTSASMAGIPSAASGPSPFQPLTGSSGPTTSTRIPDPPTWMATASGPIPTSASGMPPPPTWQPTVQLPPSSIIAANAAPAYAAPAGLPLISASGFYSGAGPNGFIEDDEDLDSDDDQVLPPEQRNMKDAPKPPPGAEHPSMGSEAHNDGVCKRCCFFPRGRCSNGYNCEFCHYEHEKRKRKNKKKKKKDGTAATVLGYGTVYAEPSQVYGAPMAMPATFAPTVMATGPLMQNTAPPPLAQPQSVDARLLGLVPQTQPFLQQQFLQQQQQFSQQVVYSTAPQEQPPVFQAAPAQFAPSSYSSIAPAQPPVAAAPTMVPPAGFMAFTAADGRQVFVQQDAPQPQPLSTLSTQPAVPPLGVTMPPPMESPKMRQVLNGPMMPPPMMSPKFAAPRGNLLQQAAAPPQTMAYAQPASVWVDSTTGPLLQQ